MCKPWLSTTEVDKPLPKPPATHLPAPKDQYMEQSHFYSYINKRMLLGRINV